MSDSGTCICTGDPCRQRLQNFAFYDSQPFRLLQQCNARSKLLSPRTRKSDEQRRFEHRHIAAANLKLAVPRARFASKPESASDGLHLSHLVARKCSVLRRNFKRWTGGRNWTERQCQRSIQISECFPHADREASVHVLEKDKRCVSLSQIPSALVTQLENACLDGRAELLHV